MTRKQDQIPSEGEPSDQATTDTPESSPPQAVLDWLVAMESESGREELADQAPADWDHLVVPVLLRALKDSDEMVRQGAAESLFNLAPSGDSVRAALREALAKETDSLPRMYEFWATGVVGELEDAAHALAVVRSISPVDPLSTIYGMAAVIDVCARHMSTVTKSRGESSTQDARLANATLNFLSTVSDAVVDELWCSKSSRKGPISVSV